MADAIEEAAKALGLDPDALRNLKRDRDRNEIKGLLKEVLEEVGLIGDDDDDDDEDDDSLRSQAKKAAAGGKTAPPKKKPAAKKKKDDDDDDDAEPVTPPVSLAARLGLTG